MVETFEEESMHISRKRCVVITLVCGAACAASFAVGLMAQAPQSALVGRTYESGDGTRLNLNVQLILML